jgi:hypothetical protein
MNKKIYLSIIMLLCLTSIAIAAPTITLINPPDGNQTYDRDMIFSWSITDSVNLKNTTLYIDGVAAYSQNISGTSVSISQEITGFSLSDHNWYVIATNVNLESNVSETRSFTIGIGCPADDPLGGACETIKGASAGIAKFIELISTPTGLLLVVLITIGVLAAIGFAIALVIKRAITRD